MSFIEITESELVKIEKVDKQHLKFAEIINKLHNELGAKFGGESTRLVEDLVKVLREHFDTEEALMKEYNYVNFFSHKLEHDRYYNKVNDYLTDLKNEKTKLDLEFLKSAKRWFFNHFKFNDKKCAEHLRAQGVS
ncbi:MAG: hemerythrin domain-containing protein [Melioribacteraceae bacterium]|nr:hemerythrin domain-containing protein [Melioribacteraceae bacterium]